MSSAFALAVAELSSSNSKLSSIFAFTSNRLHCKLLVLAVSFSFYLLAYRLSEPLMDFSALPYWVLQVVGAAADRSRDCEISNHPTSRS